MTVARVLALAAVLLAASVPVEAARQAQPVPEPPPFPQAGDRFYLFVRGLPPAAARDSRGFTPTLWATPGPSRSRAGRSI
ncbi:hypothetical protein ACFQWF_21025 [Methylorubrum suomiense]